MEKYTLFNFGLIHFEWTTALFVLVVFCCAVLLLHFFLFRPVLRTLNNRDKQQDNLQDDITKLNQEIEEIKTKIQKLKITNREELFTLKDKELRQMKNEVDRLIDGKKLELEENNQNLRKQLNQEFHQLENKLGDLSANLVEQLKQKI